MLVLSVTSTPLYALRAISQLATVAPVVAAIWGMESNYGQNTGGGPLPLTTAPTASTAVVAGGPLVVAAPSRELH